jgi:hypothetical protein
MACFFTLFSLQVREMERDLKTQELRGIDCQRVYDNCKRETERCRGELASAKEAAEQVAVITAELQEMFREVLNHTGIFCSILSTHGDYLLVL